MKKQLLFLTALFISVMGYSQTVGDTFIDNFITYEVTSLAPDTVEAIDYNVAGGTMVDIPAIVPNTVYSVTSIGNNAFSTYGLTSVIIPSTVTSINLSAFANNSLTNVVIPDGVTSIGDGAFGYNQIANVNIPDSMTTIGDLAFTFNQLTNIVIPNSVISLGAGAFSWNQLTDFTLSINVNTIGNRVFRGNLLTTVSIPNTVVTIGFEAFANNSQLTNIVIPDTVVTIGHSAFATNPLLTDVFSESTIPPTITTGGSTDTFGVAERSGINLHIPANTMGAYVTDSGALWTGFNSVTETAILAIGDTFIVDFITYEVTSITPDTVEAIDYDMVGGTVVAIPNSIFNNGITFNVIAIGEDAFAFNQLTSVTIPASVVSIGEDAFRTNQLINISIPNNIISLPKGVFYENLLTSVIIPDSVTSLGAFVFASNQLNSVDIGNGVTTIEDEAFWDNQLTSITLPNGVTSIGSAAFQNNLINSVISESITPPTILPGSDTFGDRSNINLTIPTGTIDVYVTNAGALWTGFNSVIEDASLSTSDFELANAIKVFTTTDAIKIIVSNNIRLENFTVYSITGAKVATGKETEIPTRALANGIYVLKLDFDKGTVTQKIIVN